MTMDVINSCFEGGLGLMLWLNIRRLWIDKRVQGASLAPAVFVTLWGFWNLAYYPALHQWWSFAGGLLVVLSNAIWLTLAITYRMKHA